MKIDFRDNDPSGEEGGRGVRHGKDSPKKAPSLLATVMLLMLILAILQLLLIAGFLTLNGGLSYAREYSYDLLTEKTENRKAYVENAMKQKTAMVYETARRVSARAQELLDEAGAESSALKTDKSLSRALISESAGELISLIRRDMVNDAFLILDTGTLYDGGGRALRPGLYLRDTDVEENSVEDNKDVFLEMGSSEIARAYGLPLDYEWTLRLDVSGREDRDFFYTPLETAPEGRALYELGYWSGFSRISRTQPESIKYTMPLLLNDGTAYGVIGIGLLEKTIEDIVPANDFLKESICYVLGVDFNADGCFEPLLYQGAAYERLVRKETVLSRSRPAGGSLYNFSVSDREEAVGSLQEFNLYSSASPYFGQRWALISVADKAGILATYYSLLRLFALAAVIALAFSAAFALVLARSLSAPVRAMVEALDESLESHDPVRFRSSNVAEIDRLADSISELQANLTEYASRVSRIIKASDSRIGVFQYDCTAKRVFVGESLADLLHIDGFSGADATVPEEVFRRLLRRIDENDEILDLPVFGPAAGSGASISREIQHRGADGETVFYKFSLARDRDSVLGLVQDSTDSTSKLLEANEALRLACAAAEQANNTKTDFLSRMSHDIRTPMNAIINLTAIARINLDDKRKLDDCFDKIQSSSRYLLSLINEILDMSKIEAGKFVLTEESVDLVELTDSLIEMIRPSVREKGHSLEVERGELAHRFVISDSLRLQQVFMNIMGNAVKYTPPGGRIGFRLTERPGGQEKTANYEFVFSDNGRGMSEEFQKKIFIPFEREEDVRVAKEQGSGLGMAITYNIVKMLGGDIHVESRQDEGSTFTVSLGLLLDPARAGAVSRAVPAARPEDALASMREEDFSGRRVLLVEDNELNAEVAGEILDMMHLTVETAVNGQDAIDKFAASAPGWYDLIFMDIQMPVLNGYEATKAIRAMDHPDAGTVPIVAMTANAFAEDVRAAEKSGMNGHIAKPLELDKLHAVVRQWFAE